MESKTKKKSAKQQRKAMLSILLVVAILITTAFAFLSATDSKTNVFTVGSVSILLRENFDRNLNGAIDENNNEKGTGTESRIEVNADQPIVPGQKVIKTPYIINNGKNPAYVYLSVGIPVSGMKPFYKDEKGVVAISGTDVEIPIAAYAIQEGYKDKTGYSDIGEVYFSNPSNLFGEEYTGTDVKIELFNYLNNTDFANSSERASSINAEYWAQIGSVYKTENYNYYVFAYKDILPVGESTESTALFKGVQLSSRIGEEQPAIVNYFVQEEVSGDTAGATANLAASDDVAENYILAGSTYSAIGEKLTLNTDYFVAKTGYTQKFYYEDTDTVAYTGDVITQTVTNLYGKQELIASESVNENGVPEESKYLEYVIGLDTLDTENGGPCAIVIGADSNHSDYPDVPTEVVVPASIYATLNADGSLSLSNGVFKGYLTGKTVNIDYDDDTDFENNVKSNLEAFIADTDVGALYEATELYQITNDYNKSELKDRLSEGVTVAIPVTKMSSALQNLAECLMDDDDNMMTDPLFTEYENLIKVVQNYALPDSIERLFCTIPFWLEDDDSVGITEINIPASCTTLSGYVFECQTKLQTIKFNETLTTIKEGAFYDCVSLNNVEIPKSVSVMEDYIFGGCESLTSITIPDGIQYIGDGTFNGCSSLESVIIPDSVNKIGYGVFSECSSLTSITIPESITSIGGSAFSSSGLTSLCIPNSVTEIGEYAFSSCASLTSIMLPNKLPKLSDSLFRDCSQLSSISIPNTATSIGRAAFYGCSGLTSITIPDSVNSIGDSAFSGCTGLANITIPDNVTSIGSSAFNGCTNLRSVAIPRNVTSIEAYTFMNCASLTTVSIPDGVTNIDGCAFVDCSNLYSVTYSGTISQWNTITLNGSVFSSGTTIQCTDGTISIA